MRWAFWRTEKPQAFEFEAARPPRAGSKALYHLEQARDFIRELDNVKGSDTHAKARRQALHAAVTRRLHLAAAAGAHVEGTLVGIDRAIRQLKGGKISEAR